MNDTNNLLDVDELTLLRLENMALKQQELVRQGQEIQRKFDEITAKSNKMIEDLMRSRGLAPSEYQVNMSTGRIEPREKKEQ